jgi:hypothetical protein
VLGHGEALLERAAASEVAPPRPSPDHSHHTGPVPVTIGKRPSRGCDESPLAGFTAR